MGNRIVANSLFPIHIKNHPHHFCFFRFNSQAIPFHTNQFIGTVSIRSYWTKKFALRSWLISSANQALCDGFQFVPAEHKLHISKLFIRFILKIIDLGRCDNFTIIRLKYLHDITGFQGWPSGKTLNINTNNSCIHSSIDQFQQTKHLRSGRQGFSRNYFFQDINNI